MRHPRCTVCNHTQLHDINLALLAREDTLATLEQRFGLSRSALQRHKAHLQARLSLAEDNYRNNLRLGYLFQLHQHHDTAAATAAAAQAEGNLRLIIQAVNAGVRILKHMANFEIDLDRETIYRLVTAPEYIQTGCLLPANPDILAGYRQALAQSLSAACPDTVAEAPPDPQEVPEYLRLARDRRQDFSAPDPATAGIYGFSQLRAGPSAHRRRRFPDNGQRATAGIQAGYKRDRSGTNPASI